VTAATTKIVAFKAGKILLVNLLVNLVIMGRVPRPNEEHQGCQPKDDRESCGFPNRTSAGNPNLSGSNPKTARRKNYFALNE